MAGLDVMLLIIGFACVGYSSAYLLIEYLVGKRRKE
jgi:hypothetical protein